MGVRTHWDAKGTGKAKVGELDVAVRVNQQVLRLQVAVQHTVRVAELDALEELPHIALEHGKGWDFFLGGRMKMRFIQRITLNIANADCTWFPRCSTKLVA